MKTDLNQSEAAIARGTFFHVNKYAVRPPAPGKKKAASTSDNRASAVAKGADVESIGNDIRKIAAEAERQLGSCPHVPAPQRPRRLYGVSPSAAADIAEDWHLQARVPKRTANGGVKMCKHRVDSACALVGVISAPPEFRTEGRWAPFMARSVQWLKEHYADRLRCVVEHLDEPQPHLHFWVVPRPQERFSAVHPGLRAKEDESDHASYALLNGVYKAAMSALQDEFFEEVGERFGLQRVSVKGQRFTPEEFVAHRVRKSARRRALEAAREEVAQEIAAVKDKVATMSRLLQAYEAEARARGAEPFELSEGRAIRRTPGPARVGATSNLELAKRAPVAPSAAAPTAVLPAKPAETFVALPSAPDSARASHRSNDAQGERSLEGTPFDIGGPRSRPRPR
jgi:hypothetical protein